MARQLTFRLAPTLAAAGSALVSCASRGAAAITNGPLVEPDPEENPENYGESGV